MKLSHLRFTIYDLRAPSRAVENQKSKIKNQRSEKAVALVITLLLLAVITFMAVTFLVVSRSEHGSVGTQTDLTTARFAADAALQRAEAELIAPIIATTNPFNYRLLVPTNYVNPLGFNPTLPPAALNSPTNVNYDYTTTGARLGVSDQLRNLANLLYNPRPPVFVVTNPLFPQFPDFRFYLNLNRNTNLDGSPKFDPTGFLVVTNDLNRPILDANGNPIMDYFVGDPQWIGLLQHPQYAHSADNQFISRYTYLVIPVGQTLDLNSIHNFARFSNNQGMVGSSDGFVRNQGALTAEINLAGFLADLNNNFWPTVNPNPYGFFPYNYMWANLGTANRGAAFDDAAGLLAYRYNKDYRYLATTRRLFPGPPIPAGFNAFLTSPIDIYSAGPLMTNTWWPPPGLFNPNPARVNGAPAPFPWAASDNPNRFASTQDLFDENKTAANIAPPSRFWTFTRRLLMAGSTNSSYDRYTFYRLLSQLGTDTDPERSVAAQANYAGVDRMDLNYRNVDQYGRVVPNMVTNFIAWQPTNFFVNAAIRLLVDAGYTVASTNNPNSISNVLAATYNNGVLVTNLHIPIWPTNFYTPSVHRLLQLAANIYDATTNRTDLSVYPYLPTVFRPLFFDTGAKGGGLNPVFITGYSEVVNPSEILTLTSPTPVPHDLADPNDLRPVRQFDMVYGIPLVIGSKKGLPNFNKLAGQTLVQVTRKLQMGRPTGSTTLSVNHTNQMFLVGITNIFGVEAWNSYAANWNAYAPGRNLRLVALPDMRVVVSNRVPAKYVVYSNYVTSITLPLVNNWPGYDSSIPTKPGPSFAIPLSTNISFQPGATYLDSAHQMIPITGAFELNPPDGIFYIPQWTLSVKTRLRFAIVDVAANRLLDYVNLADESAWDMTDLLLNGGTCGNTYTPNGSYGSMWCTNRFIPGDNNSPTFGVMNQIQASLGLQPVANQVDWNSALSEFPPGMDKVAAVNFFRKQYGLGPIPGPPGTQGPFYPSNTFNAPFQPFRNVYIVHKWEANDPLVHYTVGDLVDLVQTNLLFDHLVPVPKDDLGVVSTRYQPWGHSPSQGSSSVGPYELAAKDPMPGASGGSSDAWDFSTNKFPNPGWLGRVHRGTPWQTVYFKSPVSTTAAGLPLPQTQFNLPLANWQQWTGNGRIITNLGQLSTSILPLFDPTRTYTYNGLSYYVGTAPEAIFSMPTNDWHLLDLFSTSFGGNSTRGQLSINQTNLAAWSAVLSGVIVLTNTLDDTGKPALLPQVVQPAGAYNPYNTNTWTPVVRMVDAINRARYNNNTNHIFTRLGDILAVTNLTVGSPFLNTAILPADKNYSLNDAAYERIPQQILGLLKLDPTPRFVIYSWGQALKPAPRSAYTGSGQFFGLVTNYQVMAEVATRAVVHFDGVPPARNGIPTTITNLHPVIESFTVLPPD
jgi:hypothetical protein